MDNKAVLADRSPYAIDSDHMPAAMILSWNAVPDFPAREFAAGIEEFAKQCQTGHPAKAVIDARLLDQASEAFSWLRGQVEVPELEAYDAWWLAEIVPRYHDAGITRFAVATGDPSAPGKVPAPPGVDFEVGYFPDLQSALDW